MTINDEVTAAMGVSEPYCTNYQTLVYPADRAARTLRADLSERAEHRRRVRLRR